MRAIAIACAIALLALDASARPHPRKPPPPTSPIADPFVPKGATHRERDFAENPALLAEAHDLVVFDLEPAHQQGPRYRANLARYRLDERTYLLCLEEDDPHIVRIELEDARGKRVARVHRQPRNARHSRQAQPGRHCEQAKVTAGIHHLSVTHDARTIARGPRLAFVQLAAHEPALAAENGQLLGGLWALQPDPAQDPQRRQGILAAPPPDRSVANTSFTAIRPLVADFTSQSIDESALFDFSNLNRPLVGTTVLNLAKVDASGYWSAFADDGPTSSEAFFTSAPLVVTDAGNGQVELGVSQGANNVASFFFYNTALEPASLVANYDQAGGNSTRARFDLLFRFFPDGQVDTLQEGEVAIYQECNYGGKAAVFRAKTPDLAALTSSVTTLDRTAASIRLGNNTAVYLNSGAIYSGKRLLVMTDTPCLEGTTIGTDNVSSILVAPIAPLLLLSTKTCEGCKLEGVDFTGVDLSGIDLQRSDLTGANLTGVSLVNVSLRGATLDRVTGLAGAKQSQVNLSNVSLRNVDMANIELYGAQLNQADLEGSNLSGAFFSNNPGAGIAQAASLSGAHLKNVNLARAQLSGANFSSASFYGSAAVGAGTCNWTADAPNCATAAGATMNNTQFGGAYLYGVDFTDTIVQGVQFASAVLIGANFSGATISVDPSVGTDTGFVGALLQGANLAAASLTGTTLLNAFVDFRPGGNSMYLYLKEDFANFPNWHRPGQRICVFVLYGAPTTVPTTNTTLTCPDGSSAAMGNGCGPTSATPPVNARWASSLDLSQHDPAASYLQDATYTQAASMPVCTDIDTQW